ncbi:hypothetical protein ALC53_04789 [Atta colombica]|uniref:Uncharacterized protein n=1 Tax=Atta colombica TaxID=520822 RepID=A0A195BIT3_9HYME|nr:hypothetical protein ALC53_04789 [Atta colombica]
MSRGRLDCKKINRSRGRCERTGVSDPRERLTPSIVLFRETQDITLTGVGGLRNVDSCRLGAAARFLRALVPKRGATPPKPGGVGGQINTRYFTGWEMKVCFVPCLQARPRN